MVEEDEIYIHMLNYSEGDKVYVYHKNIFSNNNFEIDKNMFGIITKIKQNVIEDHMGVQFLVYKVNIKLDNGKDICIDSEKIFRKDDFILIKELKSKLENSKKEIATSLEIISEKINSL